MDTSQHIYRIRAARPGMLTDGGTPVERRAVSEHFGYLEELAARGIVILAGRTTNADPTTFGIVILAESTEENARAIMEKDPAVSSGVMTAELFPFRIALTGELGTRS